MPDIGGLNNMSKEMDTKYFYEEVKHFRDFEIEHLWQRSIFLAAFLLAVASGYGVLAEKIIFPGDSNIEVERWVLHLIACGFTYVGIIFSMLWIMMSKGSKRLYEQYEEALNYFVNRFDYKNDCVILDSEEINDFVNLNCENEKYSELDFPFYGYQPEAKELSYSILSTKGGNYSVSRINVMIGNVCLFVWSILNLWHGFCIFETQCTWSVLSKFPFAWDVFQFVVFSHVLKLVLQNLCKSSSK